MTQSQDPNPVPAVSAEHLRERPPSTLHQISEFDFSTVAMKSSGALAPKGGANPRVPVTGFSLTSPRPHRPLLLANPERCPRASLLSGGETEVQTARGPESTRR